jgi:hypothetical protein
VQGFITCPIIIWKDVYVAHELSDDLEGKWSVAILDVHIAQTHMYKFSSI